MSLEQSEIQKIVQEPEFIRAFEDVMNRLNAAVAASHDDVSPRSDKKREEILQILESLEAEDTQAAKVFELRWMSGRSLEDAAQLTGLSLREAELKWKYARAWIQSFMNNNHS